MFSLGAEKEETFINNTAYYWQFYVSVLSHRTLTGWNPLWILDMLKNISNIVPEWRRRRRLWQPIEGRGFRWMWAYVRPRHRAATVRLSPEPRCRMTRLCCSHDKDKLHPLENISSFFFSFSPSPHLFLYATGCSPNVCHTKGRWWGGRSLWKYIRGQLGPSSFTGLTLDFMRKCARCR